MKLVTRILTAFAVCLFFSLTTFAQAAKPADNPVFDPELAKRLGADDYGMKDYVFVILKTGPNDAKFVGKERDEIFAGHMTNIGKLADAGKLALAGPYGKNDRSYRGLFIFSVPTIEDAQKLVETDPAVKAGILIPEMTLWYGSAALMATGEIHKKIQKSKF